MKHIIEAHDQSINVRSVIDKGTTFNFSTNFTFSDENQQLKDILIKDLEKYLNRFIKPKTEGHAALIQALKYPFKTILENAGLVDYNLPSGKGVGINVITGDEVDMIKEGIIDPTKVTRLALENAASIASTMLITSSSI